MKRKSRLLQLLLQLPRLLGLQVLLLLLLLLLLLHDTVGYYYYDFMYNARQSVFTLFAWLRPPPLKTTLPVLTLNKNSRSLQRQPKQGPAPATVSPTRHDAAASINACPPDHAFPHRLATLSLHKKTGP
jgi:hypothetical protein